MRENRISSVAAGIIAVVLLASTIQRAMADDLSGSEIKSAFSGKSSSWKNGKFHGTQHWYRDGAQTIKGNFSGFSEDKGKWRIDGDKFCSKWKKIRKGEERCYSVTHVKGKTYKVGSATVTLE